MSVCNSNFLLVLLKQPGHLADKVCILLIASHWCHLPVSLPVPPTHIFPIKLDIEARSDSRLDIFGKTSLRLLMCSFIMEHMMAVWLLLAATDERCLEPLIQKSDVHHSLFFFYCLEYFYKDKFPITSFLVTLRYILYKESRINVWVFSLIYQFSKWFVGSLVSLTGNTCSLGTSMDILKHISRDRH